MILNTELEYKGNLFPSRIVKYEKNLNVLSFTTENGVKLEVTVRRDSILRFRYTTTGIFENDFSYAITKYASRGYNHLEVTEDDNSYIITTSKLICHISKTDLRSSIFDAKDKTLICEDEPGLPLGRKLRIWRRCGKNV